MKAWLSGQHVRAAIRVTAVTTMVGAFIYLAVCVGLVLGARAVAIQSVDHELSQHLYGNESRGDVTLPFGPSVDPDRRALYGPSYLWRIGPGGGVTESTRGAPALPASLRHVQRPITASLAGTDYRLSGAGAGSGWTVLGVSLTFTEQTQAGLVIDAVVGFIPVMAVVFGIVFLIGLRSAQPIERARRKLLEFTGDASHELRTPLQLVEAELTVALRRPRDAGAYRQSLERISLETGRMRRLVDDLLWLARFDSHAGEEAPKAADLAEAASRSVMRFAAIAAQRGLDLSLEVPDAASTAVAPPSWINRLLAVLIDNACRYTPHGGSVLVSVGGGESRASIAVDDSGPGIPDEERERIFDRFHRASDAAGGSGLGLAIADAIVRGSGGHWEVESSNLGGARFAVSWPAPRGGIGERGRRLEPAAGAPDD